MAIVNNTASAIGDQLVIQAQVPLIGLLALTSFIDSVVGTTGTRFFTKEFRYALDGINFGLWQPLTAANLSNITPITYVPFLIEYRYTRGGTDPTGLLEFNYIELQGSFTQITCGTAYNASPFADFFSCVDVILFGWCLNVLEKLFEVGIVPKYIERNQGTGDEDYLDFFRSITCFFSYLVNYARVFENFQTNPELMFNYLTQQGIYLCPNNVSLSEMQYIMQNIFDEVRKRGTVQITETVDFNGIAIRGELLRLICFDQCNEFLFRLSSQYEVGWTLNNSSPLYRGFQGFRSLTKGWEFAVNVEDDANYPQTNTASISIINDPLVGFDVFQLDQSTSGTATSIGNVADVANRIVVDPNLDYEVSFFVRQDTLRDGLSFYIWGYDAAGNAVNLLNRNTSNANSVVFVNQRLNQVGRYYKVTGIVRNTNFTNTPSQLDIGFGSELLLPSNVCSIMPQITNDGVGTGSVFIYDIKIRPLGSNRSHGFIHNSQIIFAFMQNNNDERSNTQVEDVIREYLIPYNTTIIHNWL